MDNWKVGFFDFPITRGVSYIQSLSIRPWKSFDVVYILLLAYTRNHFSNCSIFILHLCLDEKIDVRCFLQTTTTTLTQFCEFAFFVPSLSTFFTFPIHDLIMRIEKISHPKPPRTRKFRSLYLPSLLRFNPQSTSNSLTRKMVKMLLVPCYQYFIIDVREFNSDEM